MRRSRFKTALVLSGGSARALTHLGVLEEMQKHRIPIDIVTGTSMGAIIGALYAHYGEVAPVIERMRRLVGSELFIRTVSIATEDPPKMAPDSAINRFMWLFRRGVYYTQSIVRPTMVDEATYLEIMSGLIPDVRIEELSIPFAAVALDILTGEEIVLRSGSLIKAVSASAAIPGLLPPVQLDGRTLVDGGWIDNLPVVPAIAMGGHFILAVDASLTIAGLGPPPTSALESLFRCNEISRILLNQQRRVYADLVLIPQIGSMYWANFAALEPCMAAGRVVLEHSLPAILHKMHERQLKTLWGLRHPARPCNWQHVYVEI